VCGSVKIAHLPLESVGNFDGSREELECEVKEKGKGRSASKRTLRRRELCRSKQECVKSGSNSNGCWVVGSDVLAEPIRGEGGVVPSATCVPPGHPLGIAKDVQLTIAPAHHGDAGDGDYPTMTAWSNIPLRSQLKQKQDKDGVSEGKKNMLRSEVVMRFVRSIEKSEFVSLRDVKRQVKRQFLLSKGVECRSKPNGLRIHEMFDERFLRSGLTDICTKTHHLKVEEMEALHVESCGSLNSCRVEGKVREDCYFAKLRDCIKRGYWPVMDEEVPDQRRWPRNNKMSGVFSGAFEAGAAALVEGAEDALPVLKKVPPSMMMGPMIVNPMGLVLKSSDKHRAQLLTKIKVVDQETLTEANSKLVAGGHKKVKIRLTSNATATGVNSAAYVPPFSYPGVADAVDILHKGCWMGKGDVSRYYMMFPLAKESWWMFCLRVLGCIWHYVALFFGFAGGAYYASVWSAELRVWVLAKGIVCTHMMDDWLVVGNTKELAVRDMGTLTQIFTRVGLSMAEDKFEYGQVMVFLGLLIDTLRMTLSFDPIQCQYMLYKLKEVTDSWTNEKHLQHEELRHIAGKLNWFSEVLQSGRLHNAMWWQYTHHPAATWAALSKRKLLMADVEWWQAQLEIWAKGGQGLEYPILSTSEILSDPKLLQVVCSDASIPDGQGYYYGSLSDENPMFHAAQWGVEKGEPGSSMLAELRSLDHYVEHHGMKGTLVVWVTDALSAAFTVNSGRCSSEESLALMRTLLERCDIMRIQLVAVWVPRELNELADMLSHYAVRTGRCEAEGFISELQPASNADGQDYEIEQD
jgi:hypothetical protein